MRGFSRLPSPVKRDRGSGAEEAGPGKRDRDLLGASPHAPRSRDRFGGSETVSQAWADSTSAALTTAPAPLALAGDERELSIKSHV